MEIEISQETARVAITIIHIKGSVDSSTYQAFQEKADELIKNGSRYLLVNFSECSFMSSAGLRTLHNIFNKLRSLHKDVNDEQLRKEMNTGAYKSPYIKVCNLSPQLSDAFELSGFETYIEVFDHQKKAIDSF